MIMSLIIILILIFRQVVSLKTENQKLKRKIDTYEKNAGLSEIKKTIGADQFKLMTGAKRVWKWSDESLVEGYKTRFICGSKAYDVECKKRYLPSSRTLRRKLQHIHFDCGCLDEVFHLLKLKTACMPTCDKDVMIVFDEMAIQAGENYCSNLKKYIGKSTLPKHDTLATHLLVFMVVGLRARWKQIIGYYFTSDSIGKGVLKDALLQLTRKCEDIGLRVHGAVSDCGGKPRQTELFRFIWKIT